MDVASWFVLLMLLSVGIVGLMVFFGSFFTVRQQHRGIVERFGRFHRIASPGLNLKLPLIETVHEISLQILELKTSKGNALRVETKTSDDVSVGIGVVVQYFVVSGKEQAAFYQLDDPEAQLTSYVFDVVRAKVPRMKLDEVYAGKDEIADDVNERLATAMAGYGYAIQNVLITDVDPDPKVKAAMNEIDANRRLRVAASEKGEADRILVVKAAEAEAESKRLQGEGIAAQRRAIVDGLRTSIQQFEEAIPGATAADAMRLVLLTQYFDTMKDLGGDGSRVIFMPHTPGAVGDFAAQIQTAMVGAAEARDPSVRFDVRADGHGGA